MFDGKVEGPPCTMISISRMVLQNSQHCSHGLGPWPGDGIGGNDTEEAGLGRLPGLVSLPLVDPSDSDDIRAGISA